MVDAYSVLPGHHLSLPRLPVGESTVAGFHVFVGLSDHCLIFFLFFSFLCICFSLRVRWAVPQGEKPHRTPITTSSSRADVCEREEEEEEEDVVIPFLWSDFHSFVMGLSFISILCIIWLLLLLFLRFIQKYVFPPSLPLPLCAFRHLCWLWPLE